MNEIGSNLIKELQSDENVKISFSLKVYSPSGGKSLKNFTEQREFNGILTHDMLVNIIPILFRKNEIKKDDDDTCKCCFCKGDK